MKLVKLKELVTYRKQFIEINNDKKYKRCRVQLHRRGVKLRDEVLGSEIKTKKQRLCKANDFVVAEMDAKFGGYGIIPDYLEDAIVSSHYYLYELKTDRFIPMFLDVLIDSGVFQEQIKAVGSTNYSRVSAQEVLEYEIPCPSLKIQKDIVKHYFKCKRNAGKLKQELTAQQTLLKKLRQQILQEAIEGKLTIDWREQNPNVEPASELLARIQAEKSQLIKDKKIKKQKQLPPISEEEKPFALPDGWVWCRLATIATVGTGATPLTSDPSYYGGSINWMTSADTGQKYVTKTQAKITDKAILKTNCKVYPIGTLVVAMYGQGKTRGQITELKIEAATNQACATISIHYFTKSFNQFVKIYFWKMYDEIRSLARGGAQPNLNMEKIKSSVIMLPPLAEQKAIVTKVEKLLALCDQLETQITDNQTHAEQLMQAVLKEAFTQGKHTPVRGDSKCVAKPAVPINAKLIA